MINLNYITYFSSNSNFNSSSNLPIISDYQKQAILGQLLSDGYISKTYSRLEFTFKADVWEFCNWLKFDIQGNISTLTYPTPYPKDNPKQYWFSTKVHPYFKELRKEFYINNLKIIPSNLFHQFTEVSLAFLIMGDGYWDNDSKTVYICTECFTLEEVHIQLNVLRYKYKLVASLKKRNNGFRIRFSSRGNNLLLLRNLVTPHLHKSMLYKLGL